MVDVGPDGREAVLDLSAWPQPPSGTAPDPVRRTSLPPRPVRRRRLPRVGLGRLATGAFVIGVGLLAVPLPFGGCPSALSVWTSGPRALPGARPPALDDAVVTADTQAVAAARAALVTQDAQLAAARRVLALPRPTATTHRPVVASGDTAALEQTVRSDTAARDQAQAALNRVVEQQQAADDPSSYDDEVAAAQEDLDVAEARLAEDQRALDAARRTTVVAVPAPTPTGATTRGTAQAVVDQAPAVRAGLEKELARAQGAQAQHLAQRREALATWAARHARDVTSVRAANAHLASCSGTVRAPGTTGGVLTLVGVGLLVLRRRRG